MKKQKTTKPFWFKDMTHQQMVNSINKTNPVNLRYNEDLINRVHAKYPILDKTSISIVITSIFQSIRDLIILGKILNFNKLFFNTKLLVFKHTRNGTTVPALKIKISTPPSLKK